ncbi:MAG: hypothetical protein J7517_19185, partial [Sphingobium yanoikuyae]|nr:hypothetical protein [Sphingobium yanoikuyae]
WLVLVSSAPPNRLSSVDCSTSMPATVLLPSRSRPLLDSAVVEALSNWASSAQLEAEDLRVTATKGGGAYSLAGNITGSAGSRSMGGAFSVNDLEQGTRAEIKGGSYDLSGDASIGAAQQSHVITAALSGSVSLSSLAIGAAGIGAQRLDADVLRIACAALQGAGGVDVPAQRGRC